MLLTHPTGVNAALKAALKDSLTRILTPKKSVNILLDIETLRKSARVRPYTIVFVGVNGVGKSTSLSKVCFWLQQNGLKVMIAACDTFRSGAVEQLRVHSQCLNAHLYEKGYGKDAAEVCRSLLHDIWFNSMCRLLVTLLHSPRTIATTSY